jgi:hypothetical protein
MVFPSCSLQRPHATLQNALTGAAGRLLPCPAHLLQFVSPAYKQPDPSQLAAAFTESNQTCQRVREEALFEAATSYSNRKDRIEASLMDFDVDPSGRVTGIKVGQIGCVGWRDDSKCRLRQLWDHKGTGPWKTNGDDVMQGAPPKGSPQQKQQRRRRLWWQRQ